MAKIMKRRIIEEYYEEDDNSSDNNENIILILDFDSPEVYLLKNLHVIT